MASVSVQAQGYPEIEFGGFSRVDGTIAFYTRVQALLKGACVVVDVGCGRGLRQEDQCVFRRQMADLRAPDRKVIGLDVSEAGRDNPMIDVFHLIRENEAWPLESGSVDVVISDFVLEHLKEPQIFCREIQRVLKTGGYFCARTPNKWGYVAVFSRLLPSKHHAEVVTKIQLSRKGEDVFPTFYRCNTSASIRDCLSRVNMKCVVLPFESEPNYLVFSAPLYRCGAALHRLLPGPLKSTFLVFAQKQ